MKEPLCLSKVFEFITTDPKHQKKQHKMCISAEWDAGTQMTINRTKKILKHKNAKTQEHPSVESLMHRNTGTLELRKSEAKEPR